jgi:hypothetical protein
MGWVPGRTWGWLGPSGSLCNELFIIQFNFIDAVGWAPPGLFVTNSSFELFIRRRQAQAQLECMMCGCAESIALGLKSTPPPLYMSGTIHTWQPCTASWIPPRACLELLTRCKVLLHKPLPVQLCPWGCHIQYVDLHPKVHRRNR